VARSSMGACQGARILSAVKAVVGGGVRVGFLIQRGISLCVVWPRCLIHSGGDDDMGCRRTRVIVPLGCEIPQRRSMFGMGDSRCEELDVTEMCHGEEGDKFKNLRKRRLMMVPKLDVKSKSSLQEMIIERGIRDGSIN
jgi:hypothetical protein